MSQTDFALRLTQFLTDYLPGQRNLRPNTVEAYRYAFVLLLRYCRDDRKIVVDHLRLRDLQPPLILGFLEHLERERGCSSRTRNQRLAAIRSFFRYVEIEEPQLIRQCQRILAIPVRRASPKDPTYLAIEDLAEILQGPNLTIRQGRRDAVLLSLLYDTGARVQELVDLSVNDLRLSAPAQVRITGKGRKIRIVPLMRSTAQILRSYMKEYGLDRPDRENDPVFVNRWGGRLSRWGVRYLLRKYTERARGKRSTLPSKITPHTFRHSKAMHLLQSGNPAVVIKDILGHTDIQSTQVYAKADLEMKRRALKKAPGVPRRGAVPSWQGNRDLLSWLASL